MTNLPFGFGPDSGDDPDRDRGDGEASGQDGNPFGFAGQGIDMGQLGNMLSQLGQMMSQAQSSDAGPVNYDMAQKLALQAIPATHPASSVDVRKVTDALSLAEVWLDGATTFPAAARIVTAWNRRQWVEQTLDTWKLLCTPIAERVSASFTDSLPEEVRGQVGPLLGMMTQMGGMSFGTQLGSGLAQLSGEVLTSTDVGLPLGPIGTAALLPTNIAEFSQGLSIDADQVQLYLALREATHHRLYTAAPWLRDRVLDLVGRYAAAITVDFSEMEGLAQTFDPHNPAAMQELMSGQGLPAGMFEPKITAGQQAALADLETLLALVEGWVDIVVTEAAGDRLPGATALRETLRRRRVSGGPAEQALEQLVGLQLRPKQSRAAAELWQAIGTQRGTNGRDALWAHQDLLPTDRDLADPAGFVKRDEEFAQLLAGFDEIESLADVEGFYSPDLTKPDAMTNDEPAAESDQGSNDNDGEKPTDNS